MGEEERQHRRKWPWILLLVLLAGFGLFKWSTIATPVTKKDAIASFEDENSAEGPHKLAKEVKAEPTSKKKQKRERHESAARHSLSASPEDGSVSRSGTSVPMAPGPITTAVVPAEGVYTYATEGGEQISGTWSRDFPDNTYRTVVHTGPRSWTERHFFIAQRQTWASFHSEGPFLLADWTRQYLAFGPDGDYAVKRNVRIDFDPPLRVLWLPWELDRTWGGSFEDAKRNIYGSYTVTTATHQYIDVAGKAVEVWMENITIEFHGAYEGSTEVKRWTSPAYGVAVREECVADARDGPLHYTADWSLQLTSLEPAR
jgi:hypothetical protein